MVYHLGGERVAGLRLTVRVKKKPLSSVALPNFAKTLHAHDRLKNFASAWFDFSPILVRFRRLPLVTRPSRHQTSPYHENLNDRGEGDPSPQVRGGPFGGLTSLLATTRHEGPATRVAMRRRCEGLILALWGSPAPSAITATHRMHLQLMIYHISTSRILLVLNAKASRKSALNWQRRCGR